MPLSALSPYLDPIEHLWDDIQRRRNEAQRRPTTEVELLIEGLALYSYVIYQLSHSFNVQEMYCCNQ